MQTGKIILISSVYDQADILHDHLQWYLDLGVNFIIAQDFGSTDGSQDILERFSRNGQLAWFPLPERKMLEYDPGIVLATMARDRYDAEWIIQCDADEFLYAQGADLRKILRDAKKDDFTVVSVPCFNMTGYPPEQEQSATKILTLRIDRPVRETHEQQISGDLPVPYIFIRHPPKTIVRAAAFVEYWPGTHGATSSWGQSGELSELRFLHYPIRGFDTFHRKVCNTAAWFDDNSHLQSWPEWGWHWRRWIRLKRDGRLREDYESQFVSPTYAQELIGDGICSIDETIANWSWARNQSSTG